jgi:co-chaperonin GroES (HSP10)
VNCPIKPVWGRVVVKPDAIEDTDPVFKQAKSVGLVLSDDHLRKAQYRQVEGILIAIGGNAFDDWGEPLPKIGQRIIYDEYAGSNKSYGDVKYQIISDTDILGVIEDES